MIISSWEGKTIAVKHLESDTEWFIRNNFKDVVAAAFHLQSYLADYDMYKGKEWKDIFAIVNMLDDDEESK